MITFPNSLIEEISARRCIFFLGSGVSASSVSEVDNTKYPPTWEKFLKDAISLITSQSDRQEAEDQLKEKSYLDCAQIINECVEPADMNEYVIRELLRPKYKPSRLHDAIYGLDPKIVITTNYDTIYDSKCQPCVDHGLYSIKTYYEDGIINDIRSSRRLVIKGHGCAKTPENIILSKEQYYKARRDYPYFYQILDALLITNTVLFIGYSLRDPDILLALENMSISFRSLNPHYAITEKGIHPVIKKSYERTYNIRFLEYPKGQHDVIAESLEAIYQDVQKNRMVETV